MTQARLLGGRYQVGELLGYGGVADFGWIGTWRGLRWLATGALARSEAQHWPDAVLAAKLLFLAAYAAGLWAVATRRLRLTLPEVTLAVLLAFLAFYGAISAQYLVWPVPFGALLPAVGFALYSAAAALALVGFYLFLAPGVLSAGGPGPLGPHLAGVVWACGAAAVLAASGGWLAALLRRGRGRA